MATHIVEYRVDATDPTRRHPTTARELITIEQPYSNHNGGNLVFGPDGKLYTGMGDGGAANDPHRNGQNPQGAARARSCASTSMRPSRSRRSSTSGMRNPWRFAFDRKTATLYIGDVGQNLWEDVDVVAADGSRHNFGWNIVEGTHCFDADTGMTTDSCDETGLTPPVAEYPHDEGCSITGGVVYRGKALPALDGRYFYADYCTGLLRASAVDARRDARHWDWKAALDAGRAPQISSFGDRRRRRALHRRAHRRDLRAGPEDLTRGANAAG